MTPTFQKLLGRTALALALVAPTAACARPADQAAQSHREATKSTAAVSAATFVSRHEKKLLAADTDGDGKVSRAEFIAAAKAGKHDPAKRFAKLDANHDGMLDKGEVDAMLNRRFTRLDSNGDGMLSADERAAAHRRTAGNAGDGPGS